MGSASTGAPRKPAADMYDYELFGNLPMNACVWLGDEHRKRHPLGIEKNFEKKYGHFPTTEEMQLEIKSVIKEPMGSRRRG